MSSLYFLLVFLVLSVRALKESESIYCNNKMLDTENSSQSNNDGTYNSSRSIPSNNLETFMSTVEIIISRGYHVETHPVTTDDDYILMLHRIPYPKGRNSGPTGRPIFIQHGFTLSSAAFVLLPSEKALAFILADLGYDVWLGNSRGSTYSRGHVTLDSSHDDAYWQFSFDEMGRYDNPAVISHILAVTARPKLIYIGHSQGGLSLFICLHYHPELNDKIEMMVALAPVTTLAHTKALIFPLMVPLELPLRFIVWLLGQRAHFISQEGIYARFVKRFCLKNGFLAILCHNVLYSIAGPDYGNMSPALIEVVNNHVPAGVSIKNLIHLGQISVPNFKNPKLNMYNYGLIGNLKHYGQLNPPAYNLSKVALPAVHIFHGKNDFIVTPKDVEWGASKISNVKMKQVILVKDPRFNHMDFVFHRSAKELVYDHITTLLPPP